MEKQQDKQKLTVEGQVQDIFLSTKEVNSTGVCFSSNIVGNIIKTGNILHAYQCNRILPSKLSIENIQCVVVISKVVTYKLLLRMKTHERTEDRIK